MVPSYQEGILASAFLSVADEKIYYLGFPQIVDVGSAWPAALRACFPTGNGCDTHPFCAGCPGCPVCSFQHLPWLEQLRWFFLVVADLFFAQTEISER